MKLGTVFLSQLAMWAAVGGTVMAEATGVTPLYRRHLQKKASCKKTCIGLRKTRNTCLKDCKSLEGATKKETNQCRRACKPTQQRVDECFDLCEACEAKCDPTGKKKEYKRCVKACKDNQISGKDRCTATSGNPVYNAIQCQIVSSYAYDECKQTIRSGVWTTSDKDVCKIMALQTTECQAPGKADSTAIKAEGKIMTSCKNINVGDAATPEPSGKLTVSIISNSENWNINAYVDIENDSCDVIADGLKCRGCEICTNSKGAYGLQANCPTSDDGSIATSTADAFADGKCVDFETLTC